MTDVGIGIASLALIGGIALVKMLPSRSVSRTELESYVPRTEFKIVCKNIESRFNRVDEDFKEVKGLLHEISGKVKNNG